VLSRDLDRYFALRRAVGFKLDRAERWLRRFARFAAKRRERHVRIDTALEWAQSIKPSERKRRLEELAMFARYARAEDARHEVPDPTFVAIPTKTPRLPFIIDSADIRAIVGAASHLAPTGGMRAYTYATMFGLLAATGMRIGEALRLRFTDYANGGLTIRNTKFRKDRWIPLHPSTCAALDAYLALRGRGTAETDHIFISERRKAFCNTNAPLKVFTRICRTLGVVRIDGPARLHDLRHTFAVRALERCRGDRFVIREHMVSLMTYLGHACIASTYWYLHATPSLMSGIASTTERHFRGGAS
jgi:integrase/recombinase XerD